MKGYYSFGATNLTYLEAGIRVFLTGSLRIIVFIQCCCILVLYKFSLYRSRVKRVSSQSLTHLRTESIRLYGNHYLAYEFNRVIHLRSKKNIFLRYILYLKGIITSFLVQTRLTSLTQSV